jgi:hypothetical protein
MWHAALVCTMATLIPTITRPEPAGHPHAKHQGRSEASASRNNALQFALIWLIMLPAILK